MVVAKLVKRARFRKQGLYDVRVNCPSCNESNYQELKIGTCVSEGIKGEKCHKCGCELK